MLLHGAGLVPQRAACTPTELNVEAAAIIEPKGEELGINRSALTPRAQVPNLDQAAFARMVSDAEQNRPISQGP